ncbi:MAG: hypothetical protein Q7P63_13810 [Verrucomicrobiota bacterium JB022]|nr:hypothetical protein [Verrucomicrobiota bacterium JB022]
MIGISSRTVYYAVVNLVRLGAIGLALFALGALGYEIFDEDTPKISAKPVIKATENFVKATPGAVANEVKVLAIETPRIFAGPAGKHAPR